MIDLHMHSYYSDGIYSPTELAQKAKDAGISFACLTDHNAIDGLKEFLNASESIGLKVISGVEIYTHYKDKHVHLLGYNFNLDDKNLNKALKELQKKHIPQVKKTIKFLQDDRWNIEEEQVFDISATYIGIANIMRILKQDPENWERIKKDFNWHKGKIIPITEIIARYFFKNIHSVDFYSGNPVYSESEITTKEAIKLIKQAGGKTVLAHPGQHLSWKDDSLVLELKQLGIDGIEAISCHHSWQEIEHWQIVTKEAGLMITIGSDFHGYVPDEWEFLVRGPWDYFKAQRSQLNFDEN